MRSEIAYNPRSFQPVANEQPRGTFDAPGTNIQDDRLYAVQPTPAMPIYNDAVPPTPPPPATDYDNNRYMPSTQWTPQESDVYWRTPQSAPYMQDVPNIAVEDRRDTQWFDGKSPMVKGPDGQFWPESSSPGLLVPRVPEINGDDGPVTPWFTGEVWPDTFAGGLAPPPVRNPAGRNGGQREDDQPPTPWFPV